MKNIRLVVCLCAFALLGFGCSKTPPPAPKPTPSAPLTGQQQFPTFVPQENQKTPREELQQILQNYADTKSFRAKVESKSGTSDITGVMEFAKPNRFHGIIQSDPQTQMELIIVDNALFMRNVGGTWIDLSSSRGSRTLGEGMKNALSGTDGLQQLVADNANNVDKTEDPARTCSLYTLHIKDKTVGICVAGGLPKYVDTTNTDGSTNSIEYLDYNAVFTIAKPM